MAYMSRPPIWSLARPMSAPFVSSEGSDCPPRRQQPTLTSSMAVVVVARMCWSRWGRSLKKVRELPRKATRRVRGLSSSTTVQVRRPSLTRTRRPSRMANGGGVAGGGSAGGAEGAMAACARAATAPAVACACSAAVPGVTANVSQP